MGKQNENTNKDPHGTSQVVQEQNKALSTLLKELENQKAFLELTHLYDSAIPYADLLRQRKEEAEKRKKKKEELAKKR